MVTGEGDSDSDGESESSLDPVAAAALFWEDGEDADDDFDYISGSNDGCHDKEIQLLLRLTKWQAKSKYLQPYGFFCYLYACLPLYVDGISRAAFDDLKTLITDQFSAHIPSIRYAVRRLQKLTGIMPVYHDCCINSCIAFTGDKASLESCPFCGAPRYEQQQVQVQSRARSHGQPLKRRGRKRFMVIPLTQRLQLQWRCPARASMLRKYRHDLQQTHKEGVYRDVFDGKLFREFHQGLFLF